MKFSLSFVILLAFCLLSQLVWSQEAEKSTPFTEVETVICSGVEDRQPVGESDSFDPNVGQVYMWTHCHGATDTTMITHVWTWEGREVASVNLKVNSPSWRTWSSKQILPSWTGAWEVRVLDADGNILKSVKFRIGNAEPQPQAEEPAETPGDSL
ncbi:MAG: DUF2914 domain-containing protein [Candidatus Zixiibacteriota bacterium]